MRIAVGRALLFTVIGVLSAAACSTSDEPSSTESSAKVLGPDGGTLIGPGGATLVVPARALSVATRLSITRLHGGYPELTHDNGVASSVFAFEPHGQTFTENVTIRIPYARGTNDVQMVSAEPGGTWAALPGTAQDGVVQVQTSHFSFYAVIVASAPDAGDGEAGSSGMGGSAGATDTRTDAGSGGESSDASSTGSPRASAGSAGASAGPGGTNAGSGGTNAGSGGASARSGGASA